MGVKATLPKQPLERLDRQACIDHKATHGVGVHRVMTGDSDDARPVGHHDVLALTNDAKPGLLECPKRVEMIDARKFGLA